MQEDPDFKWWKIFRAWTRKNGYDVSYDTERNSAGEYRHGAWIQKSGETPLFIFDPKENKNRSENERSFLSVEGRIIHGSWDPHFVVISLRQMYLDEALNRIVRALHAI